ncbi:MAG: C25 family cysteine peptidase, partial [Candidatus Krumholzibacteria bacterium]|nr:C25 family cysteine peptidase [Candidatus Krumholzibacteria bacterium]
MKIRRELPSVFLCALLAALMAAACAESATVRLTMRFDPPRVEELAGGFSRMVFPATVQAGKPGEPSYPFRGVQALLPPGESISSVRVIRGGWKLIEGSHRLHPIQAVVPGMGIDAAKERFLYNAAAYNVNEWVYPPEATFRTHYLRGHAIAAGTVSPVGFLPATGEIGYYGTIDVVIETAASGEAHEALRLLRTDPGTAERISRIVGNPGGLSEYEDLAVRLDGPLDAYEYLIITNDQFAESFIPLGDFYTRRGMRARIMTMAEIDAAYDGIDQADMVRNAIEDQYVNHGITHVLLAGDWDGAAGAPKIVPYRGLYGEVHSSSLYTDANLPGDLYFAALDGTWNADGDAFWGEPGEDDPYSEIAVGRAPVDTPDEVATFIRKTTAYQETPVAGEIRRALLLGEKLWEDPLTYGEDEVELLVGTHADNGFTTTGIPPEFSIVRKYDRQYGTWNGTDVFSEVNAGTSWIGHAGHSNTNYVMRISRTDVTDVNFLNDGVTSNFPVLCSTGCYDGSFDNRLVSGAFETADCIAEQMVSINHGAVAFVCNSRYGWFNEGQTSGPSIHFMREFFDAVFTENYTTLGEANQRSKDETVPFLDLPDEWEPGAVRWCFYELNLLGDPALDGWTDTPDSLAVSHPVGIGRNAAGI